MDAPKCKLCEKHHYGLCNPGFVMDNLGNVDRVESASNTASNTASNRKQRWDRAAYNEYQREYMRRKRHAVQGEEEG